MLASGTVFPFLRFLDEQIDCQKYFTPRPLCSSWPELFKEEQQLVTKILTHSLLLLLKSSKGLKLATNPKNVWHPSCLHTPSPYYYWLFDSHKTAQNYFFYR